MDTVSTNSNSAMQRSTSMPGKPRYLEAKSLQRSLEKEILYEDDCDASSPIFEQNKTNASDASREHDAALGFGSKSANNLLNANNWTESADELNTSVLRRNEIDPKCARKRAYRLIEKNGRENVILRRIPETWRYIRDFVTTLIELDWKYMLSMFVGSYFFTWFIFAVLGYMVAYSHGDLLFDAETGERLGEGKEPCMVGVYNFISMLIYSIETQTTIGFGEKYPSEECPETLFLFVMQIICSIAIEGGMVSIIYAKTARPAKQITKLKFSDKAVICYRDGKLCLLFRVCDPREQQTIESKIRVYMIEDKITKEGEVIKIHRELQLLGNGEQMFIWPEIVCHVINEASPLYQYTNAKAFHAAQFELYVSIVGTSPATAQLTEARTSYVPREIHWGQRFINIIHYDAFNERYEIDYSNFNTTISVDMTHGHGEAAAVGVSKS